MVLSPYQGPKSARIGWRWASDPCKLASAYPPSLPAWDGSDILNLGSQGICTSRFSPEPSNDITRWYLGFSLTIRNLPVWFTPWGTLNAYPQQRISPVNLRLLRTSTGSALKYSTARQDYTGVQSLPIVMKLRKSFWVSMSTASSQGISFPTRPRSDAILVIRVETWNWSPSHSPLAKQAWDSA